MGNKYTTDDSYMEKWLMPDSLAEFRDLKNILFILKHPFMTTPITEIGLPEDTISKFLTRYPKIKLGGDLLALESLFGLGIPNEQSVFEILHRQKLHIGDLKSMCQRRNLVTDLITTWVNESDADQMKIGLKRAIEMLQDMLDYREELIEREFDKLHIINIELPYSLHLIHTPEIIKETTKSVLTEAFTRAIEKAVSQKVALDAKLLGHVSWMECGIKSFENFVGKFKSSPTDEPSSTAFLVPTFVLPFAAVATPTQSGTHNTLNAIFEITADKLSGTALTKTICDRLDPTIPQPHVQPKPQSNDDNQKPWWLLIRSPY